MRVWRAASLVALLISSAASVSAQDNWQAFFPVATAAERNVYFAARYVDPTGAEHHQEVWREGSQRLRRVTDGRLDLVVERDGEGEYQYRLADRSKQVLILADRTSLYRAGIFSDWNGIAHVLNEPRVPYTLAIQNGDSVQLAAGQCSWIDLVLTNAGTPQTRVCWSSDWGLPLAIEMKREFQWPPQFSITEVRSFQPDDAVFSLDSAGFIEVDARPGQDVSD